MRLSRSRELLLERRMVVAEVATTVGYTSASHFIKEFRIRFGTTPKEFADAHWSHREFSAGAYNARLSRIAPHRGWNALPAVRRYTVGWPYAGDTLDVQEPRMSVVVIAHWQISDGALGEVLAHVDELKPLSMAEPGCLGYEVFQSVDDATAVLLIERYRDDTALNEHRSAEHYQRLVVEAILPLLTDRQVEILHDASD
jgi:quinol monooxygenase YgiN